MLRWPGKLPAGLVLSSIKTHTNIGITPVIAAGESDIHDLVLQKERQILDGVNHLDTWMGNTHKSARGHCFYYYASSIKSDTFPITEVAF